MMEPAKSTLEEVYEVTWKPSEKEGSFVPHLSGEGFLDFTIRSTPSLVCFLFPCCFFLV